MAEAKSWIDEKEKKYIPGSDDASDEIFNFPYLIDVETIDYIKAHGRIMFVIRGPPGTAKSTLSSMLLRKYTQAVVCSADHYFSGVFVDKHRTKESLKKSHNYCQKRVKEACENNRNPVIVQNTHMKKWELNPYLNFAAEYHYTVIMAITIRKFIVNPEILEKTNKKGLTWRYFAFRLKQWEEAIPQYTGWFLSTVDAVFLQVQMKAVLTFLWRNEQYKRKLLPDLKGDLLENFDFERKVFCIATYCGFGIEKEKRDYYLSPTVQNVYGEAFSLTVSGFIITEKLLIALVPLTEKMQLLSITDNESFQTEVNSLSDAMCSLRMHSASNTDGIKDFCMLSESTVVEDEWMDDEKINIKNCSFIILAHSVKHSQEFPYVRNVANFIQQYLDNVIKPDGTIDNSHFLKLDNTFEICDLPNNAWLVKAKKIRIKSVFTGSYM